MFLKYHIPTLAWATVILFLTLLPTANMPPVPQWELISFMTASHAVVFFILTFLMRRGFYLQKANNSLRRHSGLYAVILSIIFGSIIEYLQSTLGWGRQGDIMDIVSNSIGTLLAIPAFNLVLRHRLLGNFL
ncbi:VanZ family protein [Adhaeribacter rhizoryzae]|uniref:VanZ family protein n=1 Tax=Adhaeribacter rhizoryzae TaxID=2607907 RepID=A0A5M6DMP0_9BACT|nr:VanZ family protein [Adhaeribacter rhizoryzae]KAA5547532.1 VanZ family protein [Adhaeribacter rhizoryzae]